MINKSSFFLAFHQSEDSSPRGFTREDSKRKAVHHHRRIPSAPNTPRQDRKPPCPGRSSSVSRDEDSFTGEDMDISLEDFIYPKSESRGDVNIDAAIKSRLLQVAERTRSAKSNEELASSPLKRSADTPPKGRKKAKAENQNIISSPQELSPDNANRRVHRSSSDVSRGLDNSPYDNDDRESRMRRFYSRFHDYAEILSVDDANVRGQGLSGSSSSATPGSHGTPGSMSVSSSGCNMQDVLDQIDSRLAMNAKLFPRQAAQSSPKPDSRESAQQQQQQLSNGTGGLKETVFSSSVHTTTSTRAAGPRSDQDTDLSLNLTNSIPPPQGPVERKVSPSGSLRQTEFPASVDTSPRELIEQETMRKLLGLDDVGEKGNNSGGVSRAGGVTPDEPGAMKVSSSSGSIGSGAPVSSTRVVRRRAEFIPSASASGQDLDNLNDLLDTLERQEPRARRRSSRKKGSPRGGGSQSSSSSSTKPSPAGSQLQSPHNSHHHNYHHPHHHYLPQPQGSSNTKNTSPRHIQVRTSPGTDSHAQPLTERDLQARLLASGFGSSAVAQAGGITKCLSVPSDIARSLENVTGSQTDMLSSVTISELSASMSSFSNGGGSGAPGVGDFGAVALPGHPHHLARRIPGHQRDRADPRHRRSSSLDSLTDSSDRLMTRTLRDINRQMDAAFRHEGSPGGGDSSLTRHHRLAASDLELSTSPEMRKPPHLLYHRAEDELSQQELQQTQDEAQWVSTDSIGQFQASDQSVTPTQATMDEAFKLFTESDQSQAGDEMGLASRQSKSQVDWDSDPDVHQGDDQVSSAVQALHGNNQGAFLDVSLLSQPSSNLKPSSPTKLQPTPARHDGVPLPHSKQAGDGSETVQEDRQSEKQTRPHRDDQIIVESPQVARARTRAMTSPDLGRAAPSRPPELHNPSHQQQNFQHTHPHPQPHHNHHQHQHSKKKSSGSLRRSLAGGRSDVANMCINRSSSSSSTSSTSSSEEFDEVASPEEDEETTTIAITQKQGLQAAGANGGRGALTLPLGAVGSSNLPSSTAPVGGSGSSDLSTSDPTLYAVVRRQHSPRSPSTAQWSPLTQRSQAAERAGVNLNQSWELDAESERMSSLCAAGLMSQRVRLSRESSTSSLQQSVSPDSSLTHALGHVRSPLATPVTEALPDIIQSTATAQSTSEAPDPASPDDASSGTRQRTSDRDNNSQSSQAQQTVPLHLALYHPDEFSMDIPPAAVSGPPLSPRHRFNVHQSPSLPLVHSARQDPVQGSKPLLRKSSTDNAISSGASVFPSPPPVQSHRPPPHQPPTRAPASAHTGLPTSVSADLQIVSGNVRIPTSLSMDSASSYNSPRQGTRTGTTADGSPLSPQMFRTRAGSDSRAVRAAAHQLQMERYRENMRASDDRSQRDHVAMEVDNLCNRLVDKMASPRSRRAPLGGSSGNPETIFSQAVPRSPRREVCQPLPSVIGAPSFSPPSHPNPGGRGITRSFSASGAVPPQSNIGSEEAENILNASREVLQSPVETPKSTGSTQTAVGTVATGSSLSIEKKRDSLTPGTESGIPVRKSSFSKIPRPRQSIDLSNQKSPGTGSLRRADSSSTTPSSISSSMSSSTHADFSPSSSSTASSTASNSSSRQAGRSTRRSSETPGASAKRSTQSRRMSDTQQASPNSPRSQPSPSSFSRSNSGGSGRGRQNLESKAQSSSSPSTSSRIPLSHRIPSPQGTEASPNLSLPRQSSKTKSPTPKPRKSSFNAKADQPKGQSSSTDGSTGSSSGKGDTTPRQRREVASRGGAAGGRVVAARKETDTSSSTARKSVVVKPMPDDSGAKLVIETQPELKKKVQTVHAKKVSQPPRQVAASIEDSDCKTGEVSSSILSTRLEQGAQSQQHSSSGPGSSVTFSGDTFIPPSSPPTSSYSKKVPPPVAKRKFRYDSKSLPRKPKQVDSQPSAEEVGVAVVGSCPEDSSIVSPPRTLAEYVDMIGSRSSLDDSVLQLAAQRQEDLFSPEELAEHQKHYGCSTGSLRAKRSVKLQSLLDLFEHKDSDSNVSDSSCGSPKTQPRERIHSGSAGIAPLTPCMEDGVPDADMDAGDPFSPATSPPDVASTSRLSERRRSRSGEVCATRSEVSRDSGDQAQINAVMMRSMPEPRAPSPKRRDKEVNANRRLSTGDKLLPPQSSKRQPSPSRRRQTQQDQSSGEPGRETRPPRYKSGSKTLSAAGDPDCANSLGPSHSQHSQIQPSSSSSPVSPHLSSGEPFPHNSSSPSSRGPHPAVLMRAQSSPDKDWRSEGVPLSPPSSPKKPVERRNSIKDLLQVFERQDSEPSGVGGGGGDSTHSRRIQPRERLGSSSPPSRETQQRGAVSMRLSLEIPSDGSLPSGPLSAGPLSQSDVKSQPLRLGPKPFYGASK